MVPVVDSKSDIKLNNIGTALWEILSFKRSESNLDLNNISTLFQLTYFFFGCEWGQQHIVVVANVIRTIPESGIQVSNSIRPSLRESAEYKDGACERRR